jgi:hypothetical protein
VSKIARLRSALLTLLEEHRRDDMLPTSNRFLYYELIARGIVSKDAPPPKPGKKTSRRPDQDMTDALTDLRENGDTPWDWIVDETRRLEDYTGWATILEGVLAGLDYIPLDPWKGDPPLILCESRSLAGVLRDLADEYGVRIAATNGQCGGFLRTVIVRKVRLNQRVLYFGDLDLCGGSIEGNTRRVLEREVGELRWERLALTAEQVEQYQLPKIIKHDRRFKGDKGVHEAVETEALSQRIIIDILRERLEQLLPEPLESVHECAEQERSRIRHLFEAGETHQ